MAYQAVGIYDLAIRYPWTYNGNRGGRSTGAIVATGDKIFIVGRVTKAGNIRHVHFLFGNIVKAGGSALTLSLQDVDLANGPPHRGDETQDQTVAISNASMTSLTWLRTNALSADRTVTQGELLAVCVEYDGAGRLGADSIALRGIDSVSTYNGESGYTHKLSGVYTANSIPPNCIFEMDDGTYATFNGGVPHSAINTHAFKQDTAGADELLMPFTFSYAVKLGGVWIPLLLNANTSNCSLLILDSGGTAVTNGTINIDANSVWATGGQNADAIYTFPGDVTIAANTQYYLSVRPTQTASTVTVFSYDVYDNNVLQFHPGGTNFTYATRLDLGSISAPTTTRRLMAGLVLSAIDVGGGGAAPNAIRYQGQDGVMAA